MSYLECFKTALMLYQGQYMRPGYQPTILSWFRHSNTKYQDLQNLENELLNPGRADPKDIIKKYLNQLSDNHHSFRNYFLDALVASFPEEHWSQFYSKPIVFYQGMLFRGTMQHYKTAFQEGMEGGRSDNVEDYANDTSGNIGLSTSKDISVAKTYSISTFQTTKGVHFEYGYLYYIDYSGESGIDIIESHKKRGNEWTAWMANHKDEVNIIERVQASDIIGCWDTRNERFIKNKAYSKSNVIFVNKEMGSEEKAELIKSNINTHIIGILDESSGEFQKINTNNKHRVKPNHFSDSGMQEVRSIFSKRL